MVQKFLGLRGAALTWVVAICSGSSFLLFGYDQGIMGSIISTNYFLDAIKITATDVDTISTIVSIYDIGCMFGALFAVGLGSKLGRKKMIAIGMSIMVVGAALQCSSWSAGQMIAGRVIAGLGNGMNTGTVPTWVSELSKAKSRGRMVATQLSIAAFGIVIAYWMNYGMFHLSGQFTWRFPIAFQIAFAVVTLAILPFLPESPRWLYSRGRHAEADEILAVLADKPIEDAQVQQDRNAIVATIAEEDAKGGFSIKSIFWDTTGQKIHIRILLAIGVQMMQELPGPNIVIYYCSSIFLGLGISDNLASILGGVVILCFWLGSVASIYLVEAIGRKKLLISGSLGMLIGYCIYLPMVKSAGKTELWVAFGATCLMISACAWSWLPVPWILGAELLPVRYRHIGSGLNAFTNWTFTFIVVKTGPIGLANIGWKLYIVYILFTAVNIPIVWFFYPETKGLTLEQIDGLFVKDHVDHFAVAEETQGADSDYEKKGSASVMASHVA